MICGTSKARFEGPGRGESQRKKKFSERGKSVEIKKTYGAFLRKLLSPNGDTTPPKLVQKGNTFNLWTNK